MQFVILAKEDREESTATPFEGHASGRACGLDWFQ
jgi:hypothetical protein